MPSGGSTSTRVHPRRSPSPTSTSAATSVRVRCGTSVLYRCHPRRGHRRGPRWSPDQRQPSTPGYRAASFGVHPGSRNSSDRLPYGIVVGSLTRQGASAVGTRPWPESPNRSPASPLWIQILSSGPTADPARESLHHPRLLKPGRPIQLDRLAEVSRHPAGRIDTHRRCADQGRQVRLKALELGGPIFRFHCRAIRRRRLRLLA